MFEITQTQRMTGNLHVWSLWPDGFNDHAMTIANASFHAITYVKERFISSFAQSIISNFNQARILK